MPPTTSAGLLALIGIFDIVGTVASGWLTDRVDSRYLLFTYYFLRGLSLLVVPWLLARPCTRACSCSSCSTVSTGWRPCRRRSRCAASTSGPRRPASSSAGSSRRTWSAPASRRRTPGGCGRRTGASYGYCRGLDAAGGLCHRRAAPVRLLYPRVNLRASQRVVGRRARTAQRRLRSVEVLGLPVPLLDSTIQLPELSRQTASTPYGRSDGSCMELHALGLELLVGLAAVVDVRPPRRPCRPRPGRGGSASTRWLGHAADRARSGAAWSSGCDGCTTVHQR